MPKERGSPLCSRCMLVLLDVKHSFMKIIKQEHHTGTVASFRRAHDIIAESEDAATIACPACVTLRPLGPHALTSAVAAVLPVAHQTSATGSAAPWLLTITRGQAFGVVFWTFAFLRWGPRVIRAIVDLVPRAHAAWARFIAQQSPYASAFARPMPKPAGSMAEAFADLGQALQGATSAAIDAASNEIFGRSLSRWADLSDDGLAEVFTEIDADNSGNITFEEMQAAVVSAHVSDTGDGRTP